MNPDDKPFRTIEVRPIAGALGAEVHGVDLSKPPEATVVAEIRRPFLATLVIFLRAQHHALEQSIPFPRARGTPVRYHVRTGLPRYPHVIRASQLTHQEQNCGVVWTP